MFLSLDKVIEADGEYWNGKNCTWAWQDKAANRSWTPTSNPNQQSHEALKEVENAKTKPPRSQHSVIVAFSLHQSPEGCRPTDRQQELCQDAELRTDATSASSPHINLPRRGDGFAPLQKCYLVPLCPTHFSRYTPKKWENHEQFQFVHLPVLSNFYFMNMF